MRVDVVLLRQVGPLPGEERGVLRQDAELGGQPDDLVDQLPVRRARGRLRFERDDAGRAPLLPDLVDQQADFAARPEAGDEPVAGRGGVDREAELEHPGRPPVIPLEGEFERVFPLVLAEHDDLVPLEHVGDSPRDQLPRSTRGAGLAGRELRVGQDRAFEPLEHAGDLHLDVLRGKHERRGRAALISDLFEQRRVHVHADPEREHPTLVRVSLAGELSDRRLGRLADRRQAVGHEQDDRQGVLGRRLAEGFEEGVVDVRPAPRGHPFEELGRPLHRRPRLADRPLGERIHGLVVEDHVERLSLVQPCEHLERGLADLRELLPTHAAGPVDDERDLTLQSRAPRGGPRRQAREEQEVAAADLRVGVREERRGHVPALPEERQPERAGLGPRVVLKIDHRDRRRRPLRPQPVARRVDRGEGRARGDFDRDLPGDGVLDRLGPRQHVVDPVSVRREEVLIRQADRLSPSRLDREDAGPDEVEPGELQQGRVAGLGDDSFVRLPRLVPRQQAGGRLRAGALEREPADDGLVGDRNEQLGLLPGRPGVAEADLQNGRRRLVADDHARDHPRDLQRGRPPRRISPRLRHDDVRRPRTGAKALAVRQAPEHGGGE